MPSTIIFIITNLLVFYFTWYYSTYYERGCHLQRSLRKKEPKPDLSSPLPFERTRFATSYNPGSTTIYGWPKKGGVYILQRALAPEFEFLGLDRFLSLRSGLGKLGSLKQDYPIEPSDEEEIFCNKCKYIGV